MGNELPCQVRCLLVGGASSDSEDLSGLGSTLSSLDFGGVAVVVVVDVDEEDEEDEEEEAAGSTFLDSFLYKSRSMSPFCEVDLATTRQRFLQIESIKKASRNGGKRGNEIDDNNNNGERDEDDKPFKMGSILGFGGVFVLQLITQLADRQEGLQGEFRFHLEW